MAVDNAKLQRKTHVPVIIFNLVLTGGFLGAVWFWVFGSVYPAFADKVVAVRASITAYSGLEKGKINSFSELSSLLSDSLPQYVSAKQAEAMGYVAALSIGKSSFLKNLAEANAEIAKKEDDILRQRDVIGDIIPTFSAPSANDAFEKGIPNRVDLKRLIQYMEDQLMRKYGFSTPFPVGIDNLRFETVDREQYKIGSFTLNLPLKGTAQRVREFVEKISNAGKIVLTPEGGIDTSLISRRGPTGAPVSSPAYSPMSNLLITVEQFTVDDFLTPTSTRQDVNATVTVRFYLRTLNYDEMQLLVNAIRDRISGAKNDPDGGMKGVIQKAIASADAKVAKLCAAAARNTSGCPLNDPQFFQSLTAVRGMTKNITDIEAAYNAAVAKLGGNRGGTEVAATLSDLYRRLDTADAYFKDARAVVERRTK